MQVHLIYIHGFQGNDTSFQSFPTHLQTHVSDSLPEGLDITVRTSLYPTYKSVKPLSFATRNFLEWLSMQPPGPVILLGHSMGGFLAAEAATDISNNPGGYPGARPHRIVGVIAFDTPYLGMHPHVVVSGIASLVPKEEKKTTAGQMNDNSLVHIVDDNVTDHWESYKTDMYGSSAPISESRHSTGPSRLTSGFLDRTREYLSSHSNDPIVRWARKHSDAPFRAGKKWLLERFQFGACMFDPHGLKTRYARLATWNGLWVNYWTQTVPKSSVTSGNEDTRSELGHPAETDNPRIFSDSDSTASASIVVEEEKEGNDSTVKNGCSKTKKEKEKKKTHSGHHFVVLPKVAFGLVLDGSEKWEKVSIGGVEDEVAAHCGLFIQGQNLEYDGLVHRVGEKILGWCREFSHWDLSTLE